MDDNEFFAKIWTLIAIVICVLILTIGVCTVHKQHEIAELVSGGADPIKSHCAIYGVNSSNAAICGVIAAK